mmetsp:Transcript_1390/g.3232  ORF Transcript_1390/g.3232 Transcript_1390/m.3232 type:complete len:223 (-) Transcript_1390:2-670(-)
MSSSRIDSSMPTGLYLRPAEGSSAARESSQRSVALGAIRGGAPASPKANSGCMVKTDISPTCIVRTASSQPRMTSLGSAPTVKLNKSSSPSSPPSSSSTSSSSASNRAHASTDRCSVGARGHSQPIFSMWYSERIASQQASRGPSLAPSATHHCAPSFSGMGTPSCLAARNSAAQAIVPASTVRHRCRRMESLRKAHAQLASSSAPASCPCPCPCPLIRQRI